MSRRCVSPDPVAEDSGPRAGGGRSLIGDIADGPEGKPALHIHIVVGTRDGSAKAGHLGEGHVRPTLEVIVTESSAHLRKVKDAETGLALIRPAA
jgi:uncharacterized protein